MTLAEIQEARRGLRKPGSHAEIVLGIGPVAVTKTAMLALLREVETLVRDGHDAVWNYTLSVDRNGHVVIWSNDVS